MADGGPAATFSTEKAIATLDRRAARAMKHINPDAAYVPSTDQVFWNPIRLAYANKRQRGNNPKYWQTVAVAHEWVSQDIRTMTRLTEAGKAMAMVACAVGPGMAYLSVYIPPVGNPLAWLTLAVGGAAAIAGFNRMEDRGDVLAYQSSARRSQINLNRFVSGPR